MPLPPAREGIVFAPGTSEVSLDFLLSELARTTGQELTLDMLARKRLAKELISLTRTDPVPAEEVYTFVESLVVQKGVLLAPLKGGSRPVMGVLWSGPEARNSFPPILDPLVVPISLTSEAAEHPALFVRMLVNLRNVDTRQLQTQLRQLLVDTTGTNNVVPAGERTLILQGRATYIAGLVQQLLEMDAAIGRGETPPPLQVEAEKGGR
ncbi:MAG: hypothetical protein ABL998_08495 [Planctomycetota bacterium]